MKKPLIVAMIALLCISMFTILVRADPTTLVYVDSSTVTAEIGETFDVNVMACDFSNLWAWQASVQWDKNILQIMSYAMGDFQALVGGSTVYVGPSIDIVNNIIARPAFQSSVRGISSPGSSTVPVKLLTITFKAIALGSCTINPTDVALRGQDPTSTTSYFRWSDVNLDLRVNMIDMGLTARSYMNGPYNPATDFNNDGVTDITDMAIVLSDFGKYSSDPLWGVTKTIYPIPTTLQSFSVTTTPDTSPPTTTISFSGTQGVPPWFTEPVTVTLAATDRSGTIAETDYSFDGFTWTAYTGPFVITTEGTTTVYYYSTDGAGNVEVTKSETIYVDTSAPVITITSPTGQDYPQGRALTVDFGAADAISGLVSVTATLECDPARIYIDPSTSTGMVGQTYTFNIWVDQVVDLYCWQFKLYFDPTILECLSAPYPPDNIFVGLPIIPVEPMIDNDAGTLVAGESLQGSGPGPSGSGKLVQIEFRVKSVGSSALAFSDPSEYYTFLLDSNLMEMPLTAEAGSFTSLPFVEGHDVAIADVVACPNVVTAGELVTILVNIQNQGTLPETIDVTAYYDSNVIATQTVVVPAFGALATLTFSWDTTSVPLGLYEISAEATPVPEETDLSDNALVDGVVSVKIPVTSGQLIDLSALKLGKYTLTVTAVDNAGNMAVESVTFRVVVHADVHIIPRVLNLRVKGGLVTAFIELPEGYNVADIDVSTVVLNGTVPAALNPATIGDYDSDGISDLALKFSYSAIVQYILPQEVQYASVTMTLSGYLEDGTSFQGSDTLRLSGLRSVG